MKVTLDFDLADYENDDKRALEVALKGEDMLRALQEINEQIFRPSWKHGYTSDIEDLVKLCPETKEGYNIAYEIIEKLHEKYVRILEEYNIDTDL